MANGVLFSLSRSTALLLAATATLGGEAVAQPYRVKDIRPGLADGYPEYLAALPDALVFAANDGVRGRELWLSDGTAEGTRLVKDIVPGQSSSEPSDLTSAGRYVFFRVGGGIVDGGDLWRTDGTASGTIPLVQAARFGGDLGKLVSSGGLLYFFFGNEFDEPELWKSDGTIGGTQRIKSRFDSIDELVAGPRPTHTVFFAAGFDQLWMSDGTERGTVLVKEFSESLNFLTAAGDKLFFRADDGDGYGLWMTDAFGSPPTLLKHFDCFPLAAVGDTLFLIGISGDGAALWKSDGTPEGTVLVKDINPVGDSTARWLTDVEGVAFFKADSPTGWGVWKSDGTASGTVLLKDIGMSEIAPVSAGGVVYFGATDGVHGTELWRSDLTPEGTVMVEDIHPGGSSDPFGHYRQVVSNGRLFFNADAGDGTGRELWALPVPSLSVGDVSVTEGDSGTTEATFTVTLSQAVTRTVTVDYRTSNGTATTNEGDYVEARGTLSFAPGETTKTVTVLVNGDTSYEGDETFDLDLDDARGAARVDSIGRATIENDDPAPEIRVDDVSLAEGNAGTTSATFTLSLSRPAGVSVDVDFETANGTASQGDDYVFKAGTRSFLPGDTSNTVTVTVRGDLFVEPDETFLLRLTRAVNCTIADGEGVGTITNDDFPADLRISDVSVMEGDTGTTPATFTVTLSAPVAVPVTVDYVTEDGTATMGTDYVGGTGSLSFPPGTTSRSLDVSVRGDTLVEPDETFLVKLRNATNVTVVDGEGLGTIRSNDVPAITVNDVTVAEGDHGTSSAGFTVSLSAPSHLVVTVDYATQDGSATAGSDYVATAGTVTFPAGTTSQLVSATVRGDDASEPDETFFVNLKDPVNATIGDAQGRGTILADDNGPSFAFGAANYTVGESAATTVVTVKRTAKPEAAATVRYATSDGTASAGQDFQAVSGSLTFSPGVMTQTFTVPLLSDTIAEGNETVLLELSDPTGKAEIASPSTALLTITDNDAAGKIQFGASAYSVNEAGPFAVITVKRTGGAAGDVRVRYETADGTATAGTDYEATSGVLSFGPGVLSQSFSVQVLDDGVVEGHQTVDLLLSDPAGGAVLGTPARATLTIQEDNPVIQFGGANYQVSEATPKATITVKRSGPTRSSVTVEYATSDGTAREGLQYAATSGTLRFGPGVTTKTFLVPIENDTVHETGETVLLSLRNPSAGAALGQQSTAVLSIGDNDPAGTIAFSAASYKVSETGGSATITVKRTGGTASDVTVDYATEDGTAHNGVNYVAQSRTLSFGLGTTARTFTVPILNPGTPAGDLTVGLRLSKPTGGTTLGTTSAAVLTILSNDPLLTFSAPAYVVGEAGPFATITVRRSGPKTGTVTVDYATSDGTATNGFDYAETSGTLTFEPNVVAKTFTVPVFKSSEVEGDQTVNLALASPAGGAALGVPGTAVLTIRTDDPSVAFGSASYSVAETSPQATITVKRSLPTTGMVTVDYATSDGTAMDGTNYMGVSGTLTFLPGAVSKTFTVPIINGTADEVSETVNLTLSGPVNANLGTPSTAVLTIGDNDVAGKVQFAVAACSVKETGGTVTIAVSRVGGAASDVTVDYATADGTASAGTNYTATSGKLTFGQGQTTQTFEVAVLDDGLAGPNLTVNLVLGNPGGGAAPGTPTTATLWIVDANP